jgi:hypothetical protein
MNVFPMGASYSWFSTSWSSSTASGVDILLLVLGRYLSMVIEDTRRGPAARRLGVFSDFVGARFWIIAGVVLRDGRALMRGPLLRISRTSGAKVAAA